ncbi:MAG: T9SS type A sorting domain-containing protein [Bacteroides sp.]|nr:T9SS type A sorting domain-containing protein [Ruminococcus flavefaciens]MCM1554004.1 T9SS type A sorting domain-containing protein [Bacteroides sp.]
MIRKILASLLFGLAAFPLAAQVSFGGTPPSFAFGEAKSAPGVQVVEHNLDVQAMMEEEKIASTLGMAPKVAVNVPVNYSPQNAGQWESLPDGTLVWRLHMQLPGALAIIVSYGDFLLPQGSSLYLYTPRRTRVLGAYTERTHPQGGPFSTEMLPGDAVVLEYVAPQGSTEADIPQLLQRLRLQIDGLGYCFNQVSVRHRQGVQAGGAKFGESEWCTININCSEGNNWQETKKSVAQMLMYVDWSWYLCTGTLVNNTAQNLRPFIISAQHCLSGGDPETIDFSKWQFTFHYEAPGCEDAEPLNARTAVGCVYRASTPQKGGSDGLLLELTQRIPEEWNVLYAGWDRRDLIPADSTAIGIHHPAGDIKKISHLGHLKASKWPMYQSEGAENAHFEVKYMRTEHGRSVTEGGSSGSGIFNAEHRLIATLTGGNTSCNDTTGVGFYGRFWYHWNQYRTDTTADSVTQIGYWLDPLNTGAQTLDAIYIDPNAPRIDLSRKALEVFRTEDYNRPSAADTFAIRTANLIAPVKVWTVEPFEVSVNGGDFDVESRRDGSGLVYVRYNPKGIRRDSAYIYLTSDGCDTMCVQVTGNSCVQLSLEPELLPHAYAESPYSLQLQASGTDAAYTYEVVAGCLPQGISLDTNGLLAGTPQEFGLFRFTVRVSEPYLCDEYFERSLYVVCDVVEEFPWSEGFEGGQIPSCWTQEYVKDSVDWQFMGGVGNPEAPVTAAAQGSYNAMFRAESYDGFSTRLISPQLDLSRLKNPALSFSYAQPAWITDQDNLNVYAKNSATADWRLLAAFQGNIDRWRDTLIALPEPGAEYFVAFEGVAHFGYGVTVDNVRVAESNVANETDTEVQGRFRCNNPVEDMLYIEIAGEPAQRLSVCDLLGRVVLQRENPVSGQTVSLKELPAGTYIVLLQGRNYQETKKVIKK